MPEGQPNSHVLTETGSHGLMKILPFSEFTRPILFADDR